MAGAGEAYIAPQFAQAGGALDNPNNAAVKRIRNLGNNSGDRRNVFGFRRTRPEQRSASAPAERKSTPVAPISGPTYKTYRPDRLVAVKFGAISDPLVTGATSDGVSLPPLGMNAFDEGRSALDALDVRALPEAAKAIVDLYSSDPAYLWVAGSSINSAARSVLAVLEDADSVGLNASNYSVEVPEDGYDVTNGAARQQELMRFEMKLSAAVADYVLDATRGRVDPNRISGYHDFKRKTPDLVSALKAVSNSDDAGAALYGYNPQGQHFTAFVEELKHLKQADQGKTIDLPEDLLLKPGQSSAETKNLVRAIEEKASDELKAEHALLLASYIDNAEYDPDIVSLVKGFQKEAGLASDGVVGPRTVRALVGETNAAKIEKVKLSMERARWLPGVLESRRVFINQPAFTATYYEDGKPEFTTRTVVGKKSNQTYFFDDTIETVEVNPYWGVPQSIIINEMLPKLQRDPSYLDRLGYQVTYNGRAVSSSGVNWHSVGRGAVGVRQPPGDDNALGELKILFPNSHAIYMHDTPSKSLFSRDMRAFSHGCVRLQDPRGMASRVLGVSVEEVGREIAQGKNKALPVSGNIPVHVSYFTAWAEPGEKVKYFADVYDRDSYLEKAIDATDAERSASS
ncbi:peptidoglycan-binding protein [Pseudohoeflea suaedae]|uniref:Peptidoglycan-binding protein n=2 Tax=Pseudohoeflea suaedae TaxID=877384 RepID=A0A4R5PKU8_9HYPH|nr:peptidoglycan-binding protein [Pseudohoeflea suaedae]